MTASHSSAREFLRSRPVPPGPSPEFDQWIDECRGLGPSSAPELLDALEHGNESEQYGAVVCLRQFDYDVWAVGYGNDLTYTVHFPNSDERIIEPDHK